MRVYKRKSRPVVDRAATAQNYVEHPHRRWNLRQAAAQRLVPLDCGCPDPWPCRCGSEPPLSDQMVDGGRDAALHVLSVGQVPLLKAEVLQALWRRGGADRELAELLHRMTEGQVA